MLRNRIDKRVMYAIRSALSCFFVLIYVYMYIYLNIYIYMLSSRKGKCYCCRNTIRRTEYIITPLLINIIKKKIGCLFTHIITLLKTEQR